MHYYVSKDRPAHPIFDRDGHVEFYTHPWCAHHANKNQELNFIRTVSFLPDLITNKLAVIAVYASTGEEILFCILLRYKHGVKCSTSLLIS